jgi:hypothetical protein
MSSNSREQRMLCSCTDLLLLAAAENLLRHLTPSVSPMPLNLLQSGIANK